MRSLDDYRQSFLDYLDQHLTPKEPGQLYGPINYILHLGGKRIRPMLTLMGCDLFGGGIEKALPAAMAVEVFHNFSLVHDDIMDDAPLRRGQQTVHEKWDINTAILSGDAMLINAYQYLEGYEGKILGEMLALFSQTAIQVCEGQQYDVDFELRTDVTQTEYLKMITYKTSVLLAAALKMGAMVAGATQENQSLIYDFGKNLGIAFQLQDDYLDAFGDPNSFGKQVGGDIIENKKTYLYLKAMELGDEQTKKALLKLYASVGEDPIEKVKTVKQIFEGSGAAKAIKEHVEHYTQVAFKCLEKLDVNADGKAVLRSFGENLMQRGN